MSIIAALANPQCHVHAFEPVGRTVERMKINLRLNQLSRRVTVHTYAAAAEFGVEMINYYRHEDFLGTGNSINDKDEKVVSRHLIQTVNVDQYLGSQQRFDTIKIDVEGYELQVLNGLRQIIKRDRPRMVIEIWKHSSAEVLALLAEFSYDCTVVEAEFHRANNYFCLPRS